MIDVQGPLITAGLVVIISSIVQIYGIIQDRRHTRVEDSQTLANAPLATKAAELGLIDQATVIQQRMIETQGSQIDELTLKVATLTAENALLRTQMMDMYIQMREMERRTDTL